MNRFGVLLLIFLLEGGFLFGQRQEWSCLVPLKTRRADVEKLLGKPDKYFGTYGTYETPYGRYSVWYASGHCKEKGEGRDWNVEEGIMTSLLVYPNQVRLIDHYFSNPQDYERRTSPEGYSRFLYISKDESLIYQTIKRPDSSEFVYTVSLEPGKNNEHLLCSAKR